MIALALVGPLTEVQTVGSIAGVALVSSGISWWLQQRRLNQALAQQRASAAAELQAMQTLAAADAEAQSCAVAAHEEREAALEAHLNTLQADLASTSAMAAQLEPARVRVADLERALSAETGRIQALEQTLSLTTNRVQDLEQRLQKAQADFIDLQAQSKARESELVTQLTAREEDQARLGSVDEEITVLKSLHSAYQTTSEQRIANLQRQLAAAEAKSSLMQKEFMSAMGVLPDAPSAAAADKDSDKRVADLEAKITQLEAEGRKRAREDGYKIAELEYRLSEALDSGKSPESSETAE